MSRTDLEAGHRFEKILSSRDLLFYREAIGLAVGNDRAGQAIVLKRMPPEARPEGWLRFGLIVVTLGVGLAVMSLALAAIPIAWAGGLRKQHD